MIATHDGILLERRKERSTSPRTGNLGRGDRVVHIGRADVLDILEHPSQERYRGQRIFVVRVRDYAYLVPFVEDETTVFLKTVIPSRKATRRYLEREGENG